MAIACPRSRGLRPHRSRPRGSWAEEGPAGASAANSAMERSPNIASTLGEFVAARKEACRKTWPPRKHERKAKRFCRLGQARLARLGLVREKGRWRARACRRRDGAFDEGRDRRFCSQSRQAPAHRSRNMRATGLTPRRFGSPVPEGRCASSRTPPRAKLRARGSSLQQAAYRD